MAPGAAYDAIADWYERDFLRRGGDPDPIGVDRTLLREVARALRPSGLFVHVGVVLGVRAREHAG